MKDKRVKIEKNELKYLINKNYTAQEIAGRLRVRVSSVYNAAIRYGLDKPKSRYKLIDAPTDPITDLPDEAAKELSFSVIQTAISDYLKCVRNGGTLKIPNEKDEDLMSFRNWFRGENYMLYSILSGFDVDPERIIKSIESKSAEEIKSTIRNIRKGRM